MVRGNFKRDTNGKKRIRHLILEKMHDASGPLTCRRIAELIGRTYKQMSKEFRLTIQYKDIKIVDPKGKPHLYVITKAGEKKLAYLNSMWNGNNYNGPKKTDF